MTDCIHTKHDRRNARRTHKAVALLALGCLAMAGCHKQTRKSDQRERDDPFRDGAKVSVRESGSDRRASPWGEEDDPLLQPRGPDDRASAETSSDDQSSSDAAASQAEDLASGDGQSSDEAQASDSQSASNPSSAGAEAAAAPRSGYSKSGKRIPPMMKLPTQAAQLESPSLRVDQPTRAATPSEAADGAESSTPTPEVEVAPDEAADDATLPDPLPEDAGSDEEESADQPESSQPEAEQPPLESGEAAAAPASPVKTPKAYAWGSELGSRALFVIDASENISAEDLATLVSAVKDAIDSASSDHEVVLTAVTNAGISHWRAQAVGMSVENKREAKRWLDGLSPSGAREMRKSLKSLCQDYASDCTSMFIALSTDGALEDWVAGAAEESTIAEDFGGWFESLEEAGCALHGIGYGSREGDAAEAFEAICEAVQGSFVVYPGSQNHE